MQTEPKPPLWLVTYPTFIWLVKHASPSLVATYSYVNPMVADFLGWFFLGEQVNSRIFAAGAVIVLGVAMITLGRSRKSIRPTAK